MLAQFNARQVRKLLWLVLALLLVYPYLPTPVAYATTRTVTNNNDSGTGSLRQTITDATAGDTINFDSDYTIVTAGFYINKQLTIDGVGHSVTINGNHANEIFYIDVSAYSVSLNNLTIINGSTTSGGGAIWNAAGHLYITNCTFTGNLAEQGGAIDNGLGKILTVTGSTFSGNSASGGSAPDGGAIYNSGGLVVTNSTFSGDSAGRYGGAIYGNASVTNSTIVSNTAATSGGGGIYNPATGSRTAINTIIANNTGGNCAGTAFGGSSTNNLSSDGTCSGGFTQSSSILVGTLGNYGGNTPTIPLLPNSDAIDAGNASSCPATDQRGVSRVGTCDIGAFESSGFAFGSLSGTPQSTLINTAFATPLGLIVTANNVVEPVISGTVTFVGPLSGASTNPITSTATIATGGAVTVTVTANSIAGGPYNVTATARGVSSSVNFILTNNSNNWLLYLPLILR